VCVRADIVHRAALRADIVRLAVLRADVVRLAALRADIVHLAALRADIVRLAVLRADIVHLAVLRADIVHRAALRADVVRLAALRADIVHLAALRADVVRLAALGPCCPSNSFVHVSCSPRKNAYACTGSEDALGDMDFKVAGGHDAITAFQMDIKVGSRTTSFGWLQVLLAHLKLLHILLTHLLPPLTSSCCTLAIRNCTRMCK